MEKLCRLKKKKNMKNINIKVLKIKLKNCYLIYLSFKRRQIFYWSFAEKRLVLKSYTVYDFENKN